MSLAQRKKERMRRTDARAAQKYGYTLRYGACTDVGCARDHNEDSLLVSEPLFAVADGMGGHEAGEVASEIAVSQLAEFAPEHLDADALEEAVREANREIMLAAHDGRGRDGMGTTLTAVMVEGEDLLIAQVGDSRAYLLHNGDMQQLTRDHSLVADLVEAGQITPEEARVHPNRSIITRALGSDPNTRPDIFEIKVKADDRLLICSDGLPTMLEDGEVKKILRREADPQRCADALVAQACAAGGYDNVTVIVIDLVGQKPRAHRKAARRSVIRVTLIVFLFVAVLGGAVWGCGQYLRTAAFLMDDNGYVAIYRGLPGSVAGFSLNTFEERTDVRVSDLQPSLAERLAEGIRVDTVEAAQELVSSYEKDIAEKEARLAEKAPEGDQAKEADASASESKVAS